MIISFFKGDTTDRDITIALDKWGSYAKINNGGTMSDTKYYIKNYTGKSGTIWDGMLLFSSVKYQINNNGPIGTTIWPSGSSKTHAEVIAGYKVMPDRLIVNDPWDGKQKTFDYYDYVDFQDWCQSLYYK